MQPGQTSSGQQGPASPAEGEVTHYPGNQPQAGGREAGRRQTPWPGAGRPQHGPVTDPDTQVAEAGFPSPRRGHLPQEKSEDRQPVTMNIDVVGRMQPLTRGEGQASLLVEASGRVAAQAGGPYFG